MALNLKGATSGVDADVDATTKALRASLYGSSTPLAFNRGEDVRAAEGVLIGGNNDGNFRRVRTDRFGSLASGNVTPLLYEPFEGAVLSANRLLATATTMAAVQAATGLTINSGNITTINTGYLLTTRKQFARMARAPIHEKIRARLEYYTNCVMELGYGFGNTATASPTVGAYFQITAGGVQQAVLTYNGVDVTTPLGVSLDITKYYTFDVLMDDDSATFIIQDTATGLIICDVSINLPLTQGRLANVTHLPAFVALRNTGVVPPTAPHIFLTDWMVGTLDVQMNSPLPHRAAQMGYGSNYHPTTFAQASQNANNAAPANATLSNTAAGYATLGGRFNFVAVAGALTDYNLFGFQVPVPYQFVCTGIDIETFNTGAAVAGTPTVLDWVVGTNGASANISTGAHIRDDIGMQDFPIGAVIGARAQRLSTHPNFVMVCEAGLHVALILRMPVATATVSQVINGKVKFHGYYE